MNAILEARDLVKQFGEFRAIDSVDLLLEEGQFHGLVGPNGSGKSTLLKCVSGALIPTQGQILFNNREISKEPPENRSRIGISMKFQITSIFPVLSVYDNILLSLQSHQGPLSLARSTTRAGFHETVMDTLHRFNLSDRTDDPAEVLSHGQQQWLEIAMALASEPSLLLLDEPTAGMSLEERRKTGELLEPLRKECSLLIVEHDLDFIRDICDVLTVLDQGKVVETGNIETIQESEKVKKVYLSRV